MSLLLSLLLCSDLLLLSSAIGEPITLSLTPVPPPSTNPLENIKYYATASRARAHHNLIKCQNDGHLGLYYRIAQYMVNLSFGTPPQTLSFIMDTGSYLSWVPCTCHFTCTGNCPRHIATFIPESSSSCKNIPCTSQQCKWLPYTMCINHTKCGFLMEYSSILDNTTGWLLSEKLTIPGLSEDDFLVGCSVSSSDWRAVVGFGRGRLSLPAQLGLTSFSYCLVSQDNPTASSDLVLNRGGGKCHAGNYTPFFTNYDYYVSLQSISIGGVNVKIPAEYLLPDAEGNGGTILDSGTHYTQMRASMYDLVYNALVQQVGETYGRAKQMENETAFKLCYEVGENETINLPHFTFHFQGNTNMDLPFANSYVYANKSVVCMAIMNYSDWGELGPSMMLGSYQQHNFYMEYDLENNRLGIRQQKCG